MSTNDPTLWLVCYDICDDRRRRKVYETMRGFGEHIQYSVFRCTLTPRQYEELRARLLSVIRIDQDQVLLVPLGKASTRRAQRMYTLGLPLKVPERSVRVF